MDQRSGASASGPGLRLHHWLDPPVLGVALVMAAAGFAQFSPAAALADVAEHFGELRDGETLAEQAGLPGTVLGAGLAGIALAAELFPTSAQATVAGWLVVAGVLGASSGLFLAGTIADRAGSFGAAMAAVCLPASLAATLLLLVPETRGLELEESAPDARRGTYSPKGTRRILS